MSCHLQGDVGTLMHGKRDDVDVDDVRSEHRASVQRVAQVSGGRLGRPRSAAQGVLHAHRLHTTRSSPARRVEDAEEAPCGIFADRLDRAWDSPLASSIAWGLRENVGRTNW
jgi:hypothetical protein